MHLLPICFDNALYTLYYTNSVESSVKLANTLSDRNSMEFEDKSLRYRINQQVKNRTIICYIKNNMLQIKTLSLYVITLNYCNGLTGPIYPPYQSVHNFYSKSRSHTLLRSNVSLLYLSLRMNHTLHIRHLTVLCPLVHTVLLVHSL